jgi:hypothetical protein
MTDVLLPVLVPYARFLDCHARRFGIVTELTQSYGGRPIDVAAAEPTRDDEPPDTAVCVLAKAPTPGIQR